MVHDVVRPWSLALIPDELETQKMCEKSVAFNSYAQEFVPDHFKNKNMCEEAVEECLYVLEDMPDHFKTQKNV